MNIKHIIALLVFMFACVGCGGEKVSSPPGKPPAANTVTLKVTYNNK